MKKYLSFSLAILFLFTSCVTVNQPNFKNKTNHKELILGKYGESTTIKTDANSETWTYNNSSFVKSNRKVIFNNEGVIISNKKILAPPAYIMRNIVAPVILSGLVFLLLIGGADEIGFGN